MKRFCREDAGLAPRTATPTSTATTNRTLAVLWTRMAVD